MFDKYKKVNTRQTPDENPTKWHNFSLWKHRQINQRSRSINGPFHGSGCRCFMHSENIISKAIINIEIFKEWEHSLLSLPSFILYRARRENIVVQNVRESQTFLLHQLWRIDWFVFQVVLQTGLCFSVWHQQAHSPR